MIKTKFILCLFLCPAMLWAGKQNDGGKLRWGLYVAPEINLPFVNLDNNQFAESKSGFSSGINIKYSLSEKAAFITGLGYSFKRYNIGNFGYHTGTQVDPMTGYTSESSIVKHIAYSSIDLPLLYQFRIINERWHLTTGIELNYFFKNTSPHYLHYDNGVKEELSSSSDNPSMLNLAPCIGMGYMLSNPDNKRAVYLEPTIKMYTRSYISEHSRLWTLGLKTSVFF